MASAEVTGVTAAGISALLDGLAVRQGALSGQCQRHGGVAAETEAHGAPTDTEALAPTLGLSAVRGWLHKSAQSVGAAAVSVASGPADRAHEGGDQCPWSLHRSFQSYAEWVTALVSADSCQQGLEPEGPHRRPRAGDAYSD